MYGRSRKRCQLAYDMCSSLVEQLIILEETTPLPRPTVAVAVTVSAAALVTYRPTSVMYVIHPY